MYRSSVITLWAVACAILMMSTAAVAQWPYSETQADPGAYDQTITDWWDETGWEENTYEWDVTFNGTSYLDDSDGNQSMIGFAVHDSDETTYAIEWSEMDGWHATNTGENVTVLWRADAPTYHNGLQIGESGIFQATFSQALNDPSWTSIQVASDDEGPDAGESVEVNNTPELPSYALILLMAFPLGLVYVRGRRRID